MPEFRVPHNPALIADLRPPHREDPWRILFSGCLLGRGCGIDGSDYGMGGVLAEFLALPGVRVLGFCPEDHTLGTPRNMPDIHGGDGRAVLEGRARVRDEHGNDLTRAMIDGAEAMLAYARAEKAELAILTDMSGACGSQVISDGCRLVEERRYQLGVGVATATLLRAGLPVLSQRDHRSLGLLRARLEPGYQPDPEARDHHQHPWVLAHLGGTSGAES